MSYRRTAPSVLRVQTTKGVAKWWYSSEAARWKLEEEQGAPRTYMAAEMSAKEVLEDCCN